MGGESFRDYGFGTGDRKRVDDFDPSPPFPPIVLSIVDRISLNFYTFFFTLYHLYQLLF